MAYQIRIAPKAAADLATVKAFQRTENLDAIDQHLQYAPAEISRSRVKRLRQLDSPEYRLRVGDYRVYCDVDENERMVKILRILSKADSVDYWQGVGGTR